MNDAKRNDRSQQGEAAESRPEAEVGPAIAAEQPSIAGGIGAAYVGRDRHVGREQDNDQQSHVSPADNDGETVPRDEVADQVGD